MFVRIVKGYGRKYMQVVESYRQNYKSKQRILWPLGLYDEDLYQQVKRNISDWKKLKRAPVVLKELDDSAELTGPLQGKGYFKSLRRHY